MRGALDGNGWGVSSPSRRLTGRARLPDSNSRNRCHHLVTTFWGWRDQQLPKGTVILNSPSGKTYVTTPGSAVLFPGLCLPTGDVASEFHRPVDYCGERIAMMPRRRRTRRQERTHLTPTTVRRRSDMGSILSSGQGEAAAATVAGPPLHPTS
jgi:hypothetical protein